MTPKAKKIIVGCYLLFLALFIFAGLKAIDWWIGQRAPVRQMLDVEGSQLTIRTLDLYPYDGWHMQAHAHHRGPMYWEGTSAFFGANIESGDRGYFIDFSLNNPPPKLTNEFRIILTGGSGAQGWGATSNDRMFYSVLERELGARFPELKIRVINLAMGASVCYQNYISLNRFAHGLSPDLILAYVGRNDYEVPAYHAKGLDWPSYIDDLQAFTFAVRGWETSPNAVWLVKLMPNLMRKTMFGVGLKMALDWDYYRVRARQNYIRATGAPKQITVDQVIADLAVPQLVHALKSIKRDFDGVPMALAWQGISDEMGSKVRPSDPDFYNKMFEQTAQSVSGFLNKEWYFINIHEMGLGKPRPDGSPLFRTHLSDQTHEIVGQILAKAIAERIPHWIELRTERKQKGQPGYGE